MKSMYKLFAVSVLALGLAACQKPVKPDTTPPAGTTSAPGEGGATTSGLGAGAAGGAASGTTTEQQQALAALQGKNVVYFEYDSSDIKPEYQAIVAAHAAYLVKYPGAHVRLEGNTDERGSREYNIGLGERRAQAVRKALMLQGVADAQITTVSYGEERPAVDGHDAAAYAKNRRVEIVEAQ